MPSPRVRDLNDYLRWVEECVDRSGGILLEPHFLEVELIEPFGELIGFQIIRQRLHFFGDVFLSIYLRVNTELEAEEYNFHFQQLDGTLIWRKDKQVGHERDAGLSHIHRDPSDPDAVEPYPEVDLQEAIDEVQEFLSSGALP